ncbi:hypothetical protein COO60DRAFT_1701047 [Scenedesmus sp. NREL 46B-D3]|nr:hypothetical protein COO60DRAFT_1701047 [Scenedesmus sp. NREL 46B-D3]
MADSSIKVRQHSPDGTLARFQELCMADPGGPQAAAYKAIELWMFTEDVDGEGAAAVNEKAASIIAEHIDLLDAQHVVPELLQLVAHVSAMRVILARWQNGEPGAFYGSTISYPDKLREFVVNEFARIKYKQARLLGFKPPFVPSTPLQLRAKL